MTQALTKPQRFDALAQICCVACSLDGYSDSPTEIHHIRHGIGKGQKAPYWQTIPLCAAHHRGIYGNRTPSVHGTPNAFMQRYGTELELLAYTDKLLEAHFERIKMVMA